MQSAASTSTVFIAEDNPILLQGLERALTANGYSVRTAIDGPALLDLISNGELPDIVLLDIMMPGMSGLEVLEAMRGNPRTADVPVILITAAAEELVPGSKLREAEVELLMKPFRLNELLTRIEANVEFSRMRSGGSAGVTTSSAAAARQH